MVFTQRRVPQKVVYVGGKISGLLFKVPLIIHYVHAKFRDLSSDGLLKYVRIIDKQRVTILIHHVFQN